MEEEAENAGGILTRFARYVCQLISALRRLLRGNENAGYLEEPEMVSVPDEDVPMNGENDEQIVVIGDRDPEGHSDEEDVVGRLENINLNVDGDDEVEGNNDVVTAEENEGGEPAGNDEIPQQGEVAVHHGDDDDMILVIEVDQPQAPEDPPQGGNAGENVHGNLEQQLLVQEDGHHHVDEELLMAELNIDQPAGYEANQPGIELAEDNDANVDQPPAPLGQGAINEGIEEHVVGAVGVNNDAPFPQVGIQQPAGHHGPDVVANEQLLWEVPLNYDWLATLDADHFDRAQANHFICEELGVVDFHNPYWPTNWLPPKRFRRMYFDKGQFDVLITQQEAHFLCERPAGQRYSRLTNIRNKMRFVERDANFNVGGTHACNPFYRFVYFRGHGSAIIRALDLMSIDFEKMYAEMTDAERHQSTPFRPPVHTVNIRPMIVSLHYDRTNKWVARNVVYCLRCFGFKHLPGGRTCGL